VLGELGDGELGIPARGANCGVGVVAPCRLVAGGTYTGNDGLWCNEGAGDVDGGTRVAGGDVDG
jgi:hypothetical protein